MINRCILAKW